MTTQDYAKIYGLDLPAKVRISKDKTKLCLTDMNEALIVGQHGELLERRSNPWAKTYAGKKSIVTPEDLAFQEGWEVLSSDNVENNFNLNTTTRRAHTLSIVLKLRKAGVENAAQKAKQVFDEKREKT